ncbi:MAG: CofH family radical SAM protein [Desulfobacterales bacterium]|jgi:aminodeoxyfutalosine synthase|nr:CofH family radical SAM protein [Desulfobacteraceae bacterium]MBT4365142.1 CofH family radical SAM protein [Desulfobacteraceae bacterium]MBT7084578.1 CofH family radical SAM protein [Desulfobacterales bacterium]MBT7696979.1 CofH family radical SAM protein [Desulfobacterales bacterium]
MNLTDRINNKKLQEIAGKVCGDIPVSMEDALYMLSTNDILDLGIIADYLRKKWHGDITYYGVNMNLNYTNICELRCPLCAFSCDMHDENAFLLSHGEIEERMNRAVGEGIDEVHIVGGLHPELKLGYFEKMLRIIKRVKPDIHIVAFTAVEYEYFAKVNNLSLEEVFKRLIDAGVDAVPGGGAEIFSPEIREKIAPKKISGEKWLDVMLTAHKAGLKTNATILYNHLETAGDIADHLLKIRALQDETGGFKTLVPLQFHEGNTQVKSKGLSTGYDDIRIYSTSRIVLQNVPHIKALWMYIGDKMAQTLQNFGVDDIGATYHNEKVVHAAGAKTPDYGTESFLRRLIETAGFKAVRTAADYRNN